MVTLRKVRLPFVVGLMAVAAACAAPSSQPGADRSTDSQATMVTWKDGRQAIRITCGDPQGCDTRAQAMCRGNYTVLEMQNMPTRGDMTTVRGAAAVVVRCAA